MYDQGLGNAMIYCGTVILLALIFSVLVYYLVRNGRTPCVEFHFTRFIGFRFACDAQAPPTTNLIEIGAQNRT